MEKLPLQHLFTRLQKAGLPLGLSEYQLLLKALQGGFGLCDRSALRQLCHILWTKSLEEKRLLDYHFDQIMAQIPDDQSELNLQSKVRHRVRIAAMGIAFFLGVGAILAFAQYAKELAKEIFEPPAVPEVLPPEPSPPDIPIEEEPLASDNEYIFEWMWWVSCGAISLGTGVGLAWSVDQLLLKRSKFSTSRPSTQTFSEVVQTVDDEIEAAQAVQPLTGKTLADCFLLSGDYLPITQRQMKRGWRYLSRPVRAGVPTELDIDATIKHISRHGVLLNPVLMPPRVNLASLLMLVDYDGSMTPFHSLTERLVATAQRGGRLGCLGVYYFNNCPAPAWNYPGDYLLYPDIAEPTSVQRVSDVLSRFASPHLSVLIISDAGAARGGFSSYRIEQTQSFLTVLRQQVRNLAWVNPLPRVRWLGSTAAVIAEQIPMFEADRLGLEAAISLLRGKNREAQ